jgi:glycerophosphoryl diester phosphodiesterase
MIIMAHRANLAGPLSAPENSPAACARALAEGFGLETDLRRDASGAFYISHDPLPRSPENSLSAFTGIFKKFPAAELAINVKELGYEAALIDLMNSGQLGARSFYFDFELLEPKTPGAAQRKIESLAGGGRVRVAARLSDRGEPLSQCLGIPAEIVWGDEFDSLWLTEKDARQIHAAGRLLYLISPEIHGFDLPTMKRRWQDFKSWGVDGLCTDYPLAAREFFGAPPL